MVEGEAVGDEIYLASGVTGTANFDLSKAPAIPTAAAAAANAPAPRDEKEVEALREKFRKEAEAQDVMNKAFEEAKAAFNLKELRRGRNEV
jgi:hypothetical protein